jgi:flavodoxin
MKICYIYYSESGNTRGVVVRCTAATGGETIEVHDLQHYNRISKYIVGGRRAMKGLMDPIEPSVIDVSGYDVIVIGSPVWAGRPTPAINAAIDAMKGCDGKKGVIFVTCVGSAGESTMLMKKALEEKKVQVVGTTAFTKKDLHAEGKIKGLIDLIMKTGAS